MENENKRHRHTRQSLWVDIGEEEGVELLADTDENDETAREQKSEIKLVFRCFVSDACYKKKWHSPGETLTLFLWSSNFSRTSITRYGVRQIMNHFFNIKRLCTVDIESEI